MNLDDTMAELEAMGTPQNRKVYARHGVSGPMFGVSYANLGKLAKKIKSNHDLAVRLWATGNHGARVLATKIAAPQEADNPLLEKWAEDLDNYILTDAFSAFVAATPLARDKLRQWTKSNEEWRGAAGWNILAILASKSGDMSEAELSGYIPKIEKRMHRSPNRVRHSMNMALIAIGLSDEKARRAAVEAARRIGKVEVDHGETGCKTPDAESYISKALKRQKERAAKRKQKKD